MGKFFSNQCRELLDKFFIVAVGNGNVASSITSLEEFIKGSFDSFLLTTRFLKQLKSTSLASFSNHTDIEESNNGANQFEIKAAINVPDSVTIRSGYSANAEMELQRADNVLAVPENALEFAGDSAFVYVLTDSVPQQQFERRAVKTGISDGIKIEIKQGLSANDFVRGLKKEN